MTITASMDIETLDTRASSVVLSMGICFFDDAKEQTFDEIVADGIEIFFDVDLQTKEGRTISQSTLNWWNQQGEDARRVLNAHATIGPRDFYNTAFYPFCEQRGLHQNWIMKECRWFTRGPHFDIAIVDSLFSNFNVSSPWKYYKVRDIRTWLEAKGLPDNLKLVKPEGMVPHNALHDAAFDAWMLQQVTHHPLENLNVDTSRK